jgi:GrpB-like predicted nucleotidyltransferase (UPF0157 family)
VRWFWERVPASGNSAPVALEPVADVAIIAAAVVADVESSLRQLLPDCQAEHIGATSMPDGVTKGDVDLSVRVSADLFDETVELLRGRFDIAQPDYWTATYASFSDTSRALPVGLQVSVIGSCDDFLVALRDLMRADSELRHAYDQVKRDAAPLGPDGYWRAKNDFLEPIVAQIARSRSAQ